MTKGISLISSFLAILLAACQEAPLQPRLAPAALSDNRTIVYVVDGRTNAPISGATLSLESQRFVTDSSGVVALPTGPWATSIRVRALGFLPYTGEMQSREAHTVVRLQRPAADARDVTRVAPSSISGTHERQRGAH